MYKKLVVPAYKSLLIRTVRSKLIDDVDKRLKFLVEIAESFVLALETA
jgi:hypothetical protein